MNRQLSEVSQKNITDSSDTTINNEEKIKKESPLLRIRNLCFSYGSHEILRQYSMTLHWGERICLSAPSGSGKTTLFRLIAGLETPSDGDITLADDAKPAYLFQEDRLLPWLSLRTNMTAVGVAKEKADEVLFGFGLWEYRNSRPDSLSGGMKRRAALSRLCCYGGNLLLLDEPFTGLDEKTRESAANRINAYFPDAAMIMITHIPSEAALLGAVVREMKLIND